MTDFHTGWNRPDIQLITQPVRQNFSSRSVPFASDLEHSVAFTILPTRPQPTLVERTGNKILVEMVSGGLSRGSGMTANEANWFATDLATFRAILSGKASFLSTTTVTIAEGDFLRGMLRHIGASLGLRSRLGTRPTSPRQLIYSFIIALEDVNV